MHAFENIISFPITNRSMKKPRSEGLTMVIDTGLGIRYAQDLVEVAGEYIDFIKLGFGTSRLINADIIKKKISIYRDHSIEVYPGGTLLEVAFMQGKLHEFLDEAYSIGFTAIEVSDGTISINENQRVDIIKAAKERGFKVITEVGKKDVSKDLTPLEYAKAIRKDLELGVFKVIIEAREAGRGVGIYDEKGDIREEKLWTIIKDIDHRNLIFEAPNRNQQVYLLLKFGPNVNLGNIHPNEVIPLEALRRGLRADTLKTLIR